MGEEMAVDAVASVVLQKLTDLLADKSFATNKIISRRLKRMKATIEKTPSGRPADEGTNENVEEIKELRQEYLGHIYSIEDSIECFALRFTRQRKKLGFLMNHALILKKFTALKMLDSKLCSIHTEVKKLNSRTSTLESSSSSSSSVRTHECDDNDEQDGEELHEVSFSSIHEETENLSSSIQSLRSTSIIRERIEHSKLMYSYSYNEEELPIVGYQCKVNDLRHRLLNPDDARVISIVGELGSGKTMLARAVFGNRAITKTFGTAAWVTVLEKSTTADVLLALLNQVRKTEAQDGTREESLEHRLVQELSGQRYFVVLDGVRSSVQWERMKNAFPDQENGSKIILTTCDKGVADTKGQMYNMEKLDHEESWTLFMTKVGSHQDPKGSVKKRIIKVCQGLPLSIVLLGSLFSVKDRRAWPETLDLLRKWQAADILKLSYNDLDNHLKLCLIYMTLFPKEMDIPVRRLQRLWLAEGFVEQPREFQEDVEQPREFQEDVAQGYFESLVKRSLIMVSKQRSDGSARKCRLQGAIHGLLLEQAQDIRLFHVHPGSDDGLAGMRRLIEYADAGIVPPKTAQIRHTRSYISFKLQKKDTPAKHVCSLVSKMVKGLGLLRVLDLEGVYQPCLPDNLGDLYHLRYLGLRWTFIDKLPKSVGELPHLQTLDLKHTRIDKIPKTVWKLKNLQHLNLNEVHLDKDTPLHFRESLPDLLTLWGLSVSHETPIKNGLSKLKHLRELGISFRFIKRGDDPDRCQGQSTIALVEWISELTDLRSLRLRSKDDSGNPLRLSLRSFSRLAKLSHMKLLGKLEQLPSFDQFPPHIKVLTLSLTFLSEDPMPILGQLPDLTVLRLLGSSYLGETMVCSSGRFKSLEVVKLWMLKGLKKWEVEDGAMKKLKEANIRSCSNLENFPTLLLQQKTFQDLILNNMPTAFKDKIDDNYQCKVSTKNF
ncbi:putative inactive disease susceptibility protein LOV1 [Salvia divinorum]|uniref:Inactive disease susceptibility protein LOV1 n=1 Tax=Salvia divinorum TaxID=28513 RepID=A0ABD1GSH2_SALDI